MTSYLKVAVVELLRSKAPDADGLHRRSGMEGKDQRHEVPAGQLAFPSAAVAVTPKDLCRSARWGEGDAAKATLLAYPP